jgi:hypothetical protein
MFTALVRYLASTTLRAQRWIAPATIYVAFVILFNTDPGPALSTYGTTLACLMPIAMWMTHLTTNCEDAPQAAISAVTAGSATRVRAAKLATSACLCLPLAAIALAAPPILHNYQGHLTSPTIVAGAAGHVLAISTGVAVGALTMPPIVERAGVTFVIAGLAMLAEIAVPAIPPARQLLKLFDRPLQSHLAAHVTWVATQTAVVVSVAVLAALALARRRS